MLLRVYVSSVGKTNATLVRQKSRDHYHRDGVLLAARFDSARAYCIRTGRIRVRAGSRKTTLP